VLHVVLQDLLVSAAHMHRSDHTTTVLYHTLSTIQCFDSGGYTTGGHNLFRKCQKNCFWSNCEKHDKLNTKTNYSPADAYCQQLFWLLTPTVCHCVLIPHFDLCLVIHPSSYVCTNYYTWLLNLWNTVIVKNSIISQLINCFRQKFLTFYSHVEG